MADEWKSNPFVDGSAKEIVEILLAMYDDDLSRDEYSVLVGHLEALVPALVELRDAGLLELNASVLTQFATLEGLAQLAADVRISEHARERCKAVRDYFLQASPDQPVLGCSTPGSVQ